jgi:lipoprotein-releasing system permease protein
MKHVASLLCKKYLQFKNKDRNISLMIKICFLGITIGTFSLMLALIIFNGFEKTIHEKMQGISAQAIMFSPGNLIDEHSLQEVLKKEFPLIVKASSASSTRQVLIDKDKSKSILFIKGIETTKESFVTNIAEKIRFPLPTQNSETGYAQLLTRLLKENQIIIGTKTAHHYKLHIGDPVTILIPEPTGKKRISLKKKQAIVSGIFKVGLEEYDNNFAFCSLPFLKQLFDEKEGVDQISIKLHPPRYTLQNYFDDYEHTTIQNIQMRFPMLHVKSWKDLYPALVSSLKLEKYVAFFILALITLVACMTMISLLFMYVQQKRRDIAILKSMGLSHNKIRSIFLRIGMRITFLATVTGLTLAAIAGFLLDQYPFIPLPDVYFVSYLPARMDLEIFIIVFLATMVLGFLATWIPAKRTKKINIAHVLRE